MIKLLFTGGGGAGNEAIFRLLEGRYEAHFADADVAAISPEIPFDRCHAIPMAAKSDFASELNTLCARLGIDLIVPGVDEELSEVAYMGALRAMVPQPAYVNTMLDKLKTVQALEVAGLDFPCTTTISNASEKNGDLTPCIAKPRCGRGSRHVRLLETADQIAAYLTLTNYAATEVVLQECLKGREYTVLMAADREARLHAVVPVRVEVKRGITLRAETESNAAVIEACQAIHKSLPARGCYNIQLILTREHSVVPFEINPRISTTFCLGLAAGIDPIAVYLSNGAPDKLLPFRSGLMLRRFWANHFKAVED